MPNQKSPNWNPKIQSTQETFSFTHCLGFRYSYSGVAIHKDYFLLSLVDMINAI